MTNDDFTWARSAVRALLLRIAAAIEYEARAELDVAERIRGRL